MIVDQFFWDMTYSVSDYILEHIIGIVYWGLFLGILLFQCIYIRKHKKAISQTRSRTKSIQFDYDDEREAVITSKATQPAFRTLLFSLIISICVISLIRLLEMNDIVPEHALFDAALGSVCLSVILSYTVYCIFWYKEYSNSNRKNIADALPDALHYD
jgi:hypothetical protein